MNAVTALDLKENESKFPHLQFGCPNIDQTIGHILSAGITELSGEAGVGKSQVCMHLALRCQLSPQLGGCGGTAAYMSCGEGEFPIRRLSQMAVAMTGALREVHGESVPALQLEQVFIEEIPTHEHLRESLEKKLPDMCRNQNLKLLIIDR
jgi:RecA/RadA recombinase